MPRLSRNAAIVVAALIPVLAGCGPEPQVDENRTTVSGIVTLNGEPLKGGTITFDSTESGLSSSASISSEGRYATTRVPIGKNFVTIETESLRRGSPTMYVKIPSKYADLTKSGLSMDVKKGTNENVNFELKP